MICTSTLCNEMLRKLYITGPVLAGWQDCNGDEKLHNETYTEDRS